jgi:alpha-ketoglutarate-dependent sulfate ester dioxygenase
MPETSTRPTDRPVADPGRRLAATRIHLAPYDVDVGPVPHLHDERTRLASLSWDHFDATPVGATLGAEIAGVDLTAELPDPVVEELHQALLDYKVLFFRDQPLTAAQHVAFARRFGPLEIHPFIPSNTGQPELVRFAKSADVGGYENGWHHDVTWRECPSKGAILHAIEVPPTGGDTLFADMHAAYDGLDDEVAARAEGLVAVHDYLQVFGHQVPAEQREATRAKYPPVEHPVVCVHPDTGRKLIFVNRFFASHLVGLDPDESTALVDLLARTADTIEYQCRFHWTPHAVAFWDNRAVQHYAASDYWPDVRVVERASIVGERPRAAQPGASGPR